ncbi:recombinase family protein [Azospirillum picis]|uniref:DNA invertase Pin-like site-specific DNA recombinase n=1 Tax=Azospirillum picis TaxID=488438 RepID=A0ABU0MPQ6_9PROT|nr:recombinase family protein [Azospirillum picis]MBP2301554.1 DNA invertase Pin-like site-specific DNA recombinase [Azospirillum picis]MDQ0535386.1 DNA invertase Pin-like site-specific DNA recombinase [Azospirillum picis]
MAVYAYTRVSTDRQASEGESLSVQRRMIDGYAQMHGLTIAHVYEERGVSGSKPLAERPEGRALLEVLVTGDIVIAAKLDRVFRSAVDALSVLADLRAKGVSLHLIDLGGDTAGPMGKLMFTMASAFAEAERDRIRERIRDVKRDQKARGRYLGGKAPVGATVTDDGDIDLSGHIALRAQVLALRSAGHGVRRIAAELTAAGASISKSTVATILQAAEGAEA